MTRTRHAVAPLIYGTLALGLAAGEVQAAEKKAFSRSAPPTPAVAVPLPHKLAPPKQPGAGADAPDRPHRAADKYEEAVKKWAGAAVKGDAGAQLRLGRTFRRGEDSQANAERALRWLRAAAQSNLPAAHYQLGLFYMAGAKGIASDLVEAFARFKIAADGGDVRAAALVLYIGVRMTAAELRRSHERITEIQRFETGPAAPPPVAATTEPSDVAQPTGTARSSDVAQPAATAKPSEAAQPAAAKPEVRATNANPATSTPAK